MAKNVAELGLLPANLPTRLVEVQNWGDFTVPRHVVRIEISGRTGHSDTRGWQVRYNGTKFFSDSLSGDPARTPATALSMAVDFLAARYRGASPPLRKKENDSKTEKTGMPGVRIARILNRKGFEVVYVETAHPVYGNAPRRFYAGTANTATPSRIEAAMKRAKALRKQLVSEHVLLCNAESLRGWTV